MTSKEIVIRTLEFTGPERLALHLPEPWGTDFVHVGADMAGLEGEWAKVGETRWERRDAWGNLWARVEDHSKGEIAKGALENIEAVDDLPLPPLAQPERYEQAARRVQEHPDRFVFGSLPGFTFNVARKLRRLDQYMMDLHLHRELIERLHDRVDSVLLGSIEQYGRIGCDGIVLCEDWGTQLGLMISPTMWREAFKPRFRTLCGAAKQHGLKIFMHSCGRITAIIPDLIEVGIDALLFDQQQVHGIDNLAQYAGQVTYMSPVDIQAVLQTGDEAAIRGWARTLVDRLWCGGRGGFIADYYNDNASIGAPPEWQAWAADEFIKAGTK
jgi:uroporphyrinogen decarboxylase